MRSVRLSLFVLAVGGLSGCATPPQMTPAEMIANRELRQSAATWRFDGFSREQVSSAIAQTFHYMDQPDVQFDYRESKVLVSRFWMVYAVLSAGFGRDYWEFKFSPDGVVKVAYDAEQSIGMFPTMPSAQFKENLEISGRGGPTANDWHLLHDRISYFLGVRRDWPQCDDYRSKPPEQQASKYLSFCDGAGIEDRAPSASDKSAGRAAQ